MKATEVCADSIRSAVMGHLRAVASREMARKLLAPLIDTAPVSVESRERVMTPGTYRTDTLALSEVVSVQYFADPIDAQEPVAESAVVEALKPMVADGTVLLVTADGCQHYVLPNPQDQLDMPVEELLDHVPLILVGDDWTEEVVGSIIEALSVGGVGNGEE